MRVPHPATIVGDIHGQLFDLIHLLQKKPPSSERTVFLGDYVDRGRYSLEVFLLLMAVKVRFPKMVTLLRGNHESRQMTEHFTFRDECLRKYDEELYSLSMSVCDALPLVAVLGGDYLCVHGGISPHMSDLNALDTFSRQKEIPSDGIMCDLLWSDPMDEDKATLMTFSKNKRRGCSVRYGY